MHILVIEDHPKHLEDAKAIAATLTDCTADFVTSLEEAKRLLKERNYDGAICDVFFPAEPGGLVETYQNAIVISDLLAAMGIHHVFNTSGNHHGRKYRGFDWKTPKAMYTEDPKGNRYDFRTAGMVIEAYPEHAESDKDTKQWRAAFRYILLSVTMLRLPDKGQSIIDSNDGLGGGFPYGDYGDLSDRFDQLLKDPKYSFVTETLARYNA